MAQFKFLLWLVYWYDRTDFFEFEWDSYNRLKILNKHEISHYEVESVFWSKKSFPLGIQIFPVSEVEDRFSIVGLSEKKRVLFIVFTIRYGKIRAISGRRASRNERKFHEKLCSQTIKNVR